MADSSSRLRSLSSSPSAASSRDGSRSTGRGTSAQAAAAKMASANRRDRLREFQTGLADKLRRAQNTPLAVNRLGIQIGAQRLLIDLADAGEILAVPDIMPVPLTRPWYRGLANVRGNLIGIVDLSLFAGGPATPIDKESRVLAFSTELRFSTGILVSRMLGLRSAADLSTVESDRTAVHPASTSASSEPNFDVFSPWVRARLLDAQDVHWQELDLAALTADPRFVDIAR